MMRACSWGFGCLLVVCSITSPAEARDHRWKNTDEATVASDCARECARAARRVFRECRANGGTRQDCLARSHEFLSECVSGCETPPTCEEVCKLRAENVLRSCLEHGGSEADCAGRAREFHEHCVETLCREPSNCETRCIHRSRTIYRECIAAGHGEDDCEEKAREALRACVEEHCTEPPGCEERCAAQSEAVYRECVEAGNEAEECEARARVALARCLEMNCPQPPDCEAQCAHKAHRVFEECIEETHNPLACAVRAREFLRHCIEENCQEPPTCEQRCAHRAEEAFHACVEQGGNEEECAERARMFLRHCLEDNCHQPPSCEDGCLERAQHQYRECVEETGDEDACAVLARQFLISCAKEHCPQPPTCEERCGRLARLIHRACIAAGGAEDECQARSAEFLKHCLDERCGERCGGLIGAQCGAGEFCLFSPGTCEIEDGVGVCRPIPGPCTEEFNPVCGCDGNTYSNECHAHQAGVSIDHRGPCKTACDPNDPTSCEENEFCLLPPETCNSVNVKGICTEIPRACPDVWEPVCGCDGMTYGNACDARAAGVSIRHRGECHEVCGGIQGIGCDDGEFCKLPPGHCCCDFQGRCVPIPQGCPDVWDPVCGCDGETYGNECDAYAAGVSIDHEGPCHKRCGGIRGIHCEEDEFCLLPPGICDSADMEGTCIEVPDECPRIWAPVCGCDGHTYANRCVAIREGAQIDHEGPCQNIMICRPNGDTCTDGTYCQLIPGTCGAANLPGACSPIPEFCPDVLLPVCGCDGKTYGNACEAAAKGVSIRHFGECED